MQVLSEGKVGHRRILVSFFHLAAVVLLDYPGKYAVAVFAGCE